MNSTNHETMETRKDIWKTSKLVINIVITIIILIITCYICYVSFIRYHYLFTWHVVFGAISYLALMPMSFLIFDNSLFGQISRKNKSWIHGIVVGLATLFAAISLYVEYYRKELFKEQYKLVHCESYHAITGLMSLILLIFANIFGLIAANTTWIRKKIKSIRPVLLKLIHNLLGQMSFIIGIISICIVLYTAWFIYYTTNVIRIVLTILIIIMTLWSLVNSVISQWNQIQILF